MRHMPADDFERFHAVIGTARALPLAGSDSETGKVATDGGSLETRRIFFGQHFAPGLRRLEDFHQIRRLENHGIHVAEYFNQFTGQGDTSFISLDGLLRFG